LLLASHYGGLSPVEVGEYFPIRADWVSGQAISGGKVAHSSDIIQQGVRDFDSVSELSETVRYRATAVAPLLDNGYVIGAIAIRHAEPKPFTEKQIEALKSHAKWSVVEMKNAELRLQVEETGRRLSVGLEREIAMGEVLRIIGSSPTELQRVLDQLSQNAARICAANDAIIVRVEGDLIALASQYGSLHPIPPELRLPIRRDFMLGRSILDRCVVHVHDLLAESDAEYAGGRELAARFGHRTVVVVPLLRQNIAIGAMSIRRVEVNPFTDEQISSLKAFADQAVIAIENTRLVNELHERNKALTEALEQQAASSEILRVISGSPTELQPVLDAIVESAARLCDAGNVVVRLANVDGVTFRVAAHYGSIPTAALDERIPIRRDLVTGRAFLERRVVHVPDVLAEPEAEFAASRAIQQTHDDALFVFEDSVFRITASQIIDSLRRRACRRCMGEENMFTKEG